LHARAELLADLYLDGFPGACLWFRDQGVIRLANVHDAGRRYEDRLAWIGAEADIREHSGAQPALRIGQLEEDAQGPPVFRERRRQAAHPSRERLAREAVEPRLAGPASLDLVYLRLRNVGDHDDGVVPRPAHEVRIDAPLKELPLQSGQVARSQA